MDVSAELLQSQGITRRAFVERVVQTLFTGRDVYVLVTVTAAIDPSMQAATASNRIAGMRALLVQETRTYRVPLADLTPDEIDVLDSFSLTDGNVSVDMKFSSQAPSMSNAIYDQQNMHPKY